MSRLDSAIRRLEAQRSCLDMAAGMIAGVPGPVLELGLGNGRTFDHLRRLLPEREIFVLDRQVAAHADCIPDEEHLILGDFRQTLPAVLDPMGAPAALVHADIGAGDAAVDAALAAFLGQTLPGLLAPGAVILSDQDMGSKGCPKGLTAVALPQGVKPGRYFAWRRD
jgi:hypothetical protein